MRDGDKAGCNAQQSLLRHLRALEHVPQAGKTWPPSIPNPQPHLTVCTTLRMSYVPAGWLYCSYSPHHRLGFSGEIAGSTQYAAVTARRGDTSVAAHSCLPDGERMEHM
jgi:hypothetical protein